MNIKIGDKYEITKDKYQYILITYNYGENDKGEKTISTKRTFFPDLKQIAKQILFDYPVQAKQLDQIAEDFAMCVFEIENHLIKAESEA